ncbi:IS1182 family transposase [bacterium]|nr:IS1182 family transposase [bacterium]
MSTSYRPYHPDQPYLLPPDPREWLAEDHLAYFVSDTVDALDLSAFYAPYEGDGRRKQPYEPAMMLKVLIYGYATGVFSSRRLARKLREDIAFRVLAAGNYPAHRTLCEFRKRHLADFEGIFVQVVRIAREVGLIKLGSVALDGSKVKANASKRKAMSYGRMQQEEARLRKEIRSLTKQAEKADAREDQRFGAEFTGDELPAEVSRRESRLAVIRAAKERLESRQRASDRERGRHEDDDQRPPTGRGRRYKHPFGEPDEKTQENFTDPDSRIMKTQGVFSQCYNGQLVVDGESRLAVAAGVTPSASDDGQLIPMLEQVERNTERLPRQVLADAGYGSEDNLAWLADRGIDGYVAQGREGKNAGATTKPLRAKMADKLKTRRGQRAYRKRKHIGEPPFGWLKSVLGFRSFSLRGLDRVGGEWNLVTLALNLRRMAGQMVWE